VIRRNSLCLSFALILESRLLNDCVSPFYINNANRRHIQPPDEDESVFVFTQTHRELFSLLNGGILNGVLVPLTRLENDSIRKVIQEHPDTCHEKRLFMWRTEAYETFPLSRLCLRQATSDVIELAYNAHPPAIHDKDRDGWSPLHYACRNQASLEVVQFLVERNPTALEAADNDGNLSLHVACAYKASLEVVQFLVERNPAALGTINSYGRLPLHLACDNNDASNADGNLPLHFACNSQASSKMLQFLVEMDFDAVETANNVGFWPLHEACCNDAPLDVVLSLVE
jgi:hypothetical protein